MLWKAPRLKAELLEEPLRTGERTKRMVSGKTQVQPTLQETGIVHGQSRHVTGTGLRTLFLPVFSELLYLSSSNFLTSLRAFCRAVGFAWLPLTKSVVTTDLSSTSRAYRVGIKCV